jgi:hypothetical protein
MQAFIPLFSQRSESVGDRHCGFPANSSVKRHSSFLRHAWRHRVVFCCIFFLFSETVLAQNDGLARKRVLTEKLDSIDLEKQLRKRRGESLEDLEKAAELLKDSVAILKRQMPQGSQVSEASTDSAAAGAVSNQRPQRFIPSIQKILPKTFFDWIVDIVGFIAIVSGIVLIIGIFGLLSKGLRKKKKAPPLPKTLHEIFPPSYAAGAYDRIPKVPTGQAEENNETIASLRKRIEDAPAKEAPDDGLLATVDEDTGRNDRVRGSDPGSIFGEISAKDPLELKKLVLEASRRGLDVSEISRRFHLSSDEVSLILRVARQNDTPPR